MIQEIYPELNHLMVTDLENPESIIITSEDRLHELAEEHGIDVDVFDFMEEEYPSALGIEWDGDDDDGEGFLQ